MSRYQKLTKKENDSIKDADGNEIYYTTFMRRVQAALIDLIIFSFIILLLFGQSNIISTDGFQAFEQNKLLKEKFEAGEIGEEEYHQTVAYINTKVFVAGLVRSAMQVFISLFYILPFWIYKSTTPGKSLMSMKIVDEKTLQPMTKKQCFLRYFGYVVSMLFLLIGFFAILFNKKRRGWHDKISGTVVIHTKNLDSEEEKNKKFKRDTIMFIGILLFLAVSRFFFN